MSLKKLISLVATAAMLMGTMFSTPAMAQGSTGFSALQGVDAQALSVDEMQAITGELNAYDIAAALTAYAGTLAKYPRLQASVSKLALYYSTNAVAINAYFEKLGILTPCQTCSK
jgi:hypothetical protein